MHMDCPSILSLERKEKKECDIEWTLRVEKMNRQRRKTSKRNKEQTKWPKEMGENVQNELTQRKGAKTAINCCCDWLCVAAHFVSPLFPRFDANVTENQMAAMFSMSSEEERKEPSPPPLDHPSPFLLSREGWEWPLSYLLYPLYSWTKRYILLQTAGFGKE